MSLDRYLEIGREVAGRYPQVAVAFVSGSLIEGFGNDTSDLDVFVLTEGPPAASRPAVLARFDQSGATIDLDYAGDVRTDTEIWPLTEVKQVAAQLDTVDPTDWRAAVALDRVRLDLAHRIRVGVAVAGEPGFLALQGLFDWDRLARILAQRFLQDYNEFAEDASGAVHAGDHITAMLNSRAALGAAVDAVLAGRGATNGKSKWRHRKLMAYDDGTLATRYLAAELEPSPEPEAVLGRSRARLRLASELAVEVAERLPDR
jgi:hypothetical protein